MDRRERLRKRIEKLATGRANDAVRLALLGEGALEGLDDMELGCVSEFKRGANGAIEVKFVDRLAALRWLCETEGESEEKKALAFLEGLSRTVEEP